MLRIVNRLDDGTMPVSQLLNGSMFISISLGHVCRVVDGDKGVFYDFVDNAVVNLDEDEIALPIAGELILHQKD